MALRRQDMYGSSKQRLVLPCSLRIPLHPSPCMSCSLKPPAQHKQHLLQYNTGKNGFYAAGQQR